MAVPFEMKQSDTTPLRDILTGISSGTISSVVINIRQAGTKTVTVSGAAATVVSATAPYTVEYDWAGGGNTVAGAFEYEWKCTFSDGTISRIPNDSNAQIIIEEYIA